MIGKIKPSTNRTTAESVQEMRSKKTSVFWEKKKRIDKRNTIMTLGKNPLFLPVIKMHAFLYDNQIMFRAKGKSFFQFRVPPDSFLLRKISKSSIMKEISNQFFFFFLLLFCCYRCLQCLLSWTTHYAAEYFTEI